MTTPSRNIRPNDELPREPIVFHPLFKDYLWGGQKLRTELAKPTGDGIWAESWEIVDWHQDQSIVAEGPLQGMSLHQLLEKFGAQLLGTEIWDQITSDLIPPQLRGRFPLLIKFLDAKQQLSVQVHPNDDQASQNSSPDLGKTEAWYVIDAEPQATIYAGLRPGVTPASFRAAIAAGNAESCLHAFRPNRGDCLLIHAGTQHALGAGLLILEVQQASNTTYRVYDWNRRDAQGNLRPLHIEQALAVTDFSRGPVNPLPAIPASDGSLLRVSCEKFAIREWRGPVEIRYGLADRFEILVVLAGELRLDRHVFSRGRSTLLPPSPDGYTATLSGDCLLLEIWIPPSENNTSPTS